MHVVPLTNNCKNAFEKKEHACFGISPFNSYFSEDRIRTLALWGTQHFESMHFFVPDIPSAFTLQALGYDSEKASWKARRQCQYLINKIEKALCSIGFSPSEAKSMLLTWQKLSATKRYNEIFENVQALFTSDSEFKLQCLEASRWVLERRVADTSVLSKEALTLAAQYLLTEIPLFIDTSSIMNVSSSVFCYHQRVAFIEDIYRKAFPVYATENQGFLIVQMELSEKAELPEVSLEMA